MNDHVTQVVSDDVYRWYACTCGETGSRFYRFMGIECAEQDALYYLESLSEPYKDFTTHSV